VEHSVSLTFHVSREGRTSFWLTKETAVPTCCGCNCDDPGPVALEAEAAVCIRSYVALVVEEHGCADCDVYAAFAALSRESLCVITLEVVPGLVAQAEAASEGAQSASAAACMRELQGGMFSSGDLCVCGVGGNGFCQPCRAVAVPERMFVVQRRYSGWYPLGWNHWWTGYTKAASDLDGVEWLRCIAAE
jgi:hypothetical protein